MTKTHNRFGIVIAVLVIISAVMLFRLIASERDRKEAWQQVQELRSSVAQGWEVAE